MSTRAATIEEYLEGLSPERRAVMDQLRNVINQHLPKEFKEQISYGMIGWCVPHSLYPPGYHCNPKDPLPFLGLASQKNFVALYHMGIYADEKLLKWFVSEYPKHCKTRLDMGKSCIRLKKMNDIPYKLIAELAGKMTVQDWISLYEKNLKR